MTVTRRDGEPLVLMSQREAESPFPACWSSPRNSLPSPSTTAGTLAEPAWPSPFPWMLALSPHGHAPSLRARVSLTPRVRRSPPHQSPPRDRRAGVMEGDRLRPRRRARQCKPDEWLDDDETVERPVSRGGGQARRARPAAPEENQSTRSASAHGAEHSKGWQDLVATIRNPMTEDLGLFLRERRLLQTPTNYPLRGELGKISTRREQPHERWQHKPTAKGTARIWFYVHERTVIKRAGAHKSSERVLSRLALGHRADSKTAPRMERSGEFTVSRFSRSHGVALRAQRRQRPDTRRVAGPRPKQGRCAEG